MELLWLRYLLLLYPFTAAVERAGLGTDCIGEATEFSNEFVACLFVLF